MCVFVCERERERRFFQTLQIPNRDERPAKNFTTDCTHESETKPQQKMQAKAQNQIGKKLKSLLYLYRAHKSNKIKPIF